MPKLHEVLAIEGDVAGEAKKILDETRHTLKQRTDHFIGETLKTEYFDESLSHLNITEHRALTESVPSKLEYMAGAVARYYDAFYSKEASNQKASADIILENGKVIATAVPAVVLLGLESRLKELRSVIESIPTLQPGVEWTQDPTAELPGVYRTVHPETRYVTQRTIQPVELSPATKEHKAQVQSVDVDVKVAKKEVTRQAGMYSPHDKSVRLSRVDELIRAIKKARQRANQVEAVPAEGFGATLMEFVLS
jgi:hypothetical protein